MGADYKVKDLKLAEQGKKQIEWAESRMPVLQQLRALVHRHEQTWLSALSDAELATYIDTLHRVQDGVIAAIDETE